MDIALALGGGGSRGNTHIGIIRVLEEAGFRIRTVAGTSAGGIIAACFAAGYSPDDMEKIFLEADQSKFYARSSGDNQSILGLEGVSKILEGLFGDKKLEDLIIRCGLTAVDIKSASEVVLTEGRLVDAVLATIALPGIFPPFVRGDYLLVDGGVLDPVPVSVARKLGGDLPVVAVVLSPAFDTDGPIKGIHLPASIPAPIIDRIQRTRLAQAINIFLLSVDVGGRMLADLRLQIDHPELIIRPDVGHIGLLDKVDIREVVQLGEEAMLPHIDELKSIAGWQGKTKRKLANFISREKFQAGKK
jgi:NTE family protein